MEKLETTHIGYSTKIWILGAALSPILFVVYEIITAFNSLTLDAILSGFEDMSIFILAIFVGALVSIPNYLLLRLGTKTIFRKYKDVLERRFWTQVLVIVLWYLIFAIIFGFYSIIDAFTNFPILYLITLTLGVWLFDVSDNKFEAQRMENILDDEVLRKE